MQEKSCSWESFYKNKAVTEMTVLGDYVVCTGLLGNDVNKILKIREWWWQIVYK